MLFIISDTEILNEKDPDLSKIFDTLKAENFISSAFFMGLEIKEEAFRIYSSK